MRIESTLPPELYEAVEPHLERLGRYAPPWLYLLYVIKGEGSDATPCDISSQYEYRNGTMRVYPAFYDETDRARSELMLHELMHTHVERLCEFARYCLEISGLKGRAKAKAVEDLRKISEATVSDLMAAISQPHAESK